MNSDGVITFDEFFATMQKFIEGHGELNWMERLHITFSEPGNTECAIICGEPNLQDGT